MDAARALEGATFVDYSELPGAIDDIAARCGLPTVNVSLVAGVDAKRVLSYATRADETFCKRTGIAPEALVAARESVLSV